MIDKVMALKTANGHMIFEIDAASVFTDISIKDEVIVFGNMRSEYKYMIFANINGEDKLETPICMVSDENMTEWIVAAGIKISGEYINMAELYEAIESNSIRVYVCETDDESEFHAHLTSKEVNQ